MSETVLYKSLQDTIKELNNKFGLRLKLITTRETFIAQILDTVGNATEEQQGSLSPDAVDVYNALLSESTTGVESDEDLCPAYGISYEAADPECVACDKSDECNELTEKAVVTAKPKKESNPPKKEKKEKPVKEAKAKKEPAVKAEVAKSRYGHKAGSLAAMMDDMLWDGSTIEKMVSAVVEKFGGEVAKTTSKVKGYMPWLEKTKGVVTILYDGVYKTEVETI